MEILGSSFFQCIKSPNKLSERHTLLNLQNTPSDVFVSSDKINTDMAATQTEQSSRTTGKTNIDYDMAVRAAKKVSNDEDIQKALVDMALNEAVVIRTKKDATPFLKKIYNGIDERYKKNLVVLDINPQTNRGMPKSNHLISQWFIEANHLSMSQLITLPAFLTENNKSVKPQDLCSSWYKGSKTAKAIQRNQNDKNNSLTVRQAVKIIEDAMYLADEDKILEVYSTEDLGHAIYTVKEKVKRNGYAGGLAAQLKEVIVNSGEEPLTIVIPDDCSLSGSSMLCDTVKILDKVFDEADFDDKKVNVIFAPMITGSKAEKAFNNFMSPDFDIDDAYLYSISALNRYDNKKSEKTRNAFKKIKEKENITFSLTNEAVEAVHFTETDTFKKLGETNPLLQQELLYIMQGPTDGEHALFGGFGDCGVMVITPTESFTLGENEYAGKIPTNSVGYMEVLGHEAGVLNEQITEIQNGEEIPVDKGIFTKGTGNDYSHYCEWEELNSPSKRSDRIPIEIKNGAVLLKSA